MSAHARHLATFSVAAKLVVGTSEVDVHVTDLTTHGVAASIPAASLTARLRHALAAGAWIHVELAFDGHPMVLSGRIFWSNASYAGDARVLIELEGLDAAALRVISTWMSERAGLLHQV
jgi:hypothetical protein